MPEDIPEIARELVARARDGDDRALERLVEAAYPLVHRWSLVHTGDPADADDLTQDVLIRMIRRLDSFRGNARFGTWLYSVTRNAAIDRQRRRSRRRRADEAPALCEALAGVDPVDPAHTLERRELDSLLRSFFDELPERQRQVFDLVELQGVSTIDVADRLGIEPVSVRAHLFKARRHLRSRILECSPELAEGMG